MVEQILGERVKPPPVLAKSEQVGLVDLPVDNPGRHVRRGLLSATDYEAENKEKSSLSTALAFRYLKAEGSSCSPSMKTKESIA